MLDVFALQMTGVLVLVIGLYFIIQHRKSGKLQVYGVTVGSYGERVKTLLRFGSPISDEEDQAMLMSLISRSLENVETLLAKLFRTGSRSFMEKYYIGYGDDSIGDCGSAVLIVENVSLIAAKAIQHDRLYRGIESSTRFIDFSQLLDQRRFLCTEHYAYAEKLMAFYRKIKAVLLAKMELDKPNTKQRADRMAQINDIARGFLPTGVSTTVAVKMSLRQIRDTLPRLMNNPLPEVESIGTTMLGACKIRYPHSFNRMTNSITENQNSRDLQYGLLMNPPPFTESFPLFFGQIKGRDIPAPLEGSVDLELYYPTVRVKLVLDYGCYRDLQRHNSVIKNFPRLTAKFGFEDWYRSRLPAELMLEAEKLIREGEEIGVRDNDKLETQYCLPLGYRVEVFLKGGFLDFQHILKLRTGESVHPVLRRDMIQLGKKLDLRYPGVFQYNSRLDPDADSKGRGSQTITPL